MRHRVVSQVGPALLLLIGLAFLAGSVFALDLGSARRMGPGAFPALVGGLLVMLALVELVQNARRPRDFDRPDPIAMAAVAGGVAAFAFLVPLAWVIPAAAMSVLITASAVPQFRWPGRLILAVCVSLGVWLVFVVGLGLPLVPIAGF